jgi:hypothetical protein
MTAGRAGGAAWLSRRWKPATENNNTDHDTVKRLVCDTFIVAPHQTQRCLPLIDLRLISDAEANDAHPIEPSVAGGAKIAAAMARVVRGHEFENGQTEVVI